ncbi:hypothetical protein [Lysobacter gummosus]
MSLGRTAPSQDGQKTGIRRLSNARTRRPRRAVAPRGSRRARWLK